MAAITDQPASPTIESAASPGLLASRSWTGTALLVIATAIAAAASAWLGYRNHLEPVESPQQGAVSTPAPMQESPVDASRDPAIGAMAPSPGPSTQGDGKSAGLTWPLWEFRLRQPIPPRDPSLTPLPWRLIGSALSGGKWSVIVLRQGGTVPEYFFVDQELPGGYRIKSIGDEDVTLAQGKRLMVLSYIGSR